MLKQIFFKLHIAGIIFVLLGWVVTRKILIIYPFVILSWKINSNKCILSQLELLFFNETFVGTSPIVPEKHRYIFYGSFVLGLMYHSCTW